MNKIFVLIVVILVAVIALMNIFVSKSAVKDVSAQTVTTVTPCRSPLDASGNPCVPKTPTKEELEIRGQRAKEWEERKKKLLGADFPLKSETMLDVDGDGKPDKILYQIKPWQQDFEGLLKITSADEQVLWEHEFFMSSRDLAKFLVEVLEYESVTQWVKSVFEKQAPYSFKADTRKLKPAELSDNQINHAAKLYSLEPKKLKSEILMQKTNRIYTYRAEWREDLMQIVFIPSLKKFVCFSRGY